MAPASGRVQVIEVHIKCKRNQKIANRGGIPIMGLGGWLNTGLIVIN